MCRIKIKLDSLAMVSQAVVSGVLFCTSSVADASADYTFKTPEPGVRSPESAKSEGGRFQVLWRLSVYRRNIASKIVFIHRSLHYF